MSLTLDPEGDCVQNDIAQMSDSELVERLRDYGADPGPIVATTRRVYEKKLMKLMGGTSEEFENCNRTEDFEAEAYSDSDDGGELDIKDQHRSFAEDRGNLTKYEFAMKNPKESLLAERSQDWLKADLDKAGAVPFASAPPQVAVLPLPHPKIAQPGSPSRQDPMQQKKLPSPPNVSPASEEYDYGPLDTAVLQAPLIERAATYSPKSITLAVKKDLKFLEFPKRPEREFDLYRSPTGISATRRPPIRGAAHSDYASPLLSRRVPEMYARPRLTQHDLLRAKTVLVAKQRSVPIWVRVVITVTLLVFILLVYIAMEENFEMPSEILESKGDKRSDPGV
uniref:lamina-associated polypeptide 2, isoforms beta/gamma-like isoform X3 n=1 Tax=Myxine glutinosa TaxID=7769 RepID=UPI00358E0430